MGMFDKDKEYGLRLDQSFDLGEPFIVWGAVVKEETIDTSLGAAEVAELTCSPISDPGDKLEYNTVASAIVAKVAEASPDDFPAVCELRRVKSKKFGTDNVLVLQYIKDYIP